MTLQLQNLYCFAVDMNSAALLKFVEGTLQGIFLDAEMIGQFLTGHRKQNRVGLLTALLLFQEENNLVADTQQEHSYLLGKSSNQVRKNHREILSQTGIKFEQPLKIC